MTFVVKKMTLEDELFVYSQKNNLIINKFGSTQKKRKQHHNQLLASRR
jgi:hypothetical protein